MAQAVSPRPLTADAWVHLRSVHVRFVVDNVAKWQVFLRGFRFSLVNIIPPVLHTRLHLSVTVTRVQTGDAWEPSEKERSFGNREALLWKVLSLRPKVLKTTFIVVLMICFHIKQPTVRDPPIPSTFPSLELFSGSFRCHTWSSVITQSQTEHDLVFWTYNLTIHLLKKWRNYVTSYNDFSKFFWILIWSGLL